MKRTMKKFAFISRHVPTQQQISIAAECGIVLDHVGDRDGFAVDPMEFRSTHDGAVVVHAAAALRLLGTNWPIGVFDNVNRAAVGELPKFETTRLHVYAPIGQLVVDSIYPSPMCYEKDVSPCGCGSGNTAQTCQGNGQGNCG